MSKKKKMVAQEKVTLGKWLIDAIGRRECEWIDMKTDMKQIHFSVDKMPQLCKR